ncbi:GH32 C-terminal domain-containing protein [Demequina sp. SO4-18]|uniref:GH32 C-terminal domain-containing protein n=1 Tax=Demequina sp. SO4-18 TaxID=3401026 RepID=UPI003B591307
MESPTTQANEEDQPSDGIGRPSPRPTWHLTPARNWMNDPNGLVHVDGVYHAFFQYNAGGEGWSDMSWGHAVSEDLLAWRELDVAIPATANEQAYSGSAVVDHGNTSGLGDGGTDPIVAVYTAATKDGLQAQSLAFSQDRGATWQRYDRNPVLDRGSREFRDPKVFRFEGADGHARWIMVVVEAVAHEVLVYSSDNLRDWTWESAFDHPTPLDEIWECPDLFPLPVDGDEADQRWVKLLSTHDHDRTDEQGSTMRWILGDFDGRRFTPAPGETWRLLDHGRDFYAGVTFSDAPDGRRLMLGWMSNWQYAHEAPTAPFRGAMSLVRELSLRTVVSDTGADARVELVQTPIVPEGLGLRSEDEGDDEGLVVGLAGVVSIESVGSARTVSVELCSGDDALATVTLDANAGEVVFERASAGVDAIDGRYASVRRMPWDGGLVEVFLDAHLVEVFACDGASVMSHQAFVGPDGWRVRVIGGAAADVTVAVPSDTE